MEYTKGEWRYCKANQGKGCSCGLVWSVKQDAVVAIAITEDETGKRPHKQMVANAHLISAAPAMYKALIGACGSLKFYDTDDLAIEEIEQAMSKAEGK